MIATDYNSKNLPGRYWALLLCVAALGCDASAGTQQRITADAGTEGPTACLGSAECGPDGLCIGGTCQPVRPCTVDEDCTDGVCHTTRRYCVECDGLHPDECAQGQTCRFDFTCSAPETPDPMPESECSGSCTDRSQCAPDGVCRGGQCCAPPERCAGPADCPPARPQCNTQTGQCMGGACASPQDCDAQPGCRPGSCDCQNGMCVSVGPECAQDEDCFENGRYARKFCGRASPRRCTDAPPCSSGIECAGYGLTCDLDTASPSFGHCKNGTPCRAAQECDQATEVCDNGQCTGRSCLNDPNFCGPDEVCDQMTGRCTQAASCVRDQDCMNGYWCDAGTCALGCRDNQDCPGGICNASHMCETVASSLCGACATTSDCPAGTECRANPLTGALRCQEPCSLLRGENCTIDPTKSCLFLWCGCL